MTMFIKNPLCTQQGLGQGGDIVGRNVILNWSTSDPTF